MGLCSNRHFLLTICTLQLVTTIERQVFDFLGFMWVPILVNFFNIIFVILGFFGAFQYRPKYIISYCVWNGLWLGWNVFLTCFYLNAGILDKDSDLLNLGTGSFSWWQINGPGCKPHYNNTVPDRPDVYRPVRPDQVTGCVLDYEIIEILHSSTQCLLAVMAVIGGICLSRVFLEEDDSSQLRRKKKKKQPRPLYSVEYTQPEPTSAVGAGAAGQEHDNVSPKPMTPRRVKRRSVISRDGTRRSSRRSSVRQSRRKNPVNRIMEHQESLYANAPATIGGLTNQNVTSLSQATLNYDRISGHWDRDRNSVHFTGSEGWQPDMGAMAASSPNIWSQESAAAAATAYPGNLGSSHWESASSTRNLTESWQGAPMPGGGVDGGGYVGPAEQLSPMQWQGQSNPSFQQTSTQSLNGEDLDELYGNRPASARSSYSNYHGVRATPQVPSRTDLVRQSQRQFVLSGPPAYQDTVI